MASFYLYSLLTMCTMKNIRKRKNGDLPLGVVGLEVIVEALT